MSQPLRIAICGGGIGGLFLALVLKKYAGSKNLVVDIYEAGPKFTEIGAGITIWGRSRSLINTVGLGDALEKRAVVPSMTFRKSDTQEPFEWHNLFVPNGTALPRTEMLKLLLDHLPPAETPFLTTHFSKRLTSYEQDAEGVTLHFADGSVSKADILIGADGVGSATRRQMYSDLAERARPRDPRKADELLGLIPPSWTGTYAYRTLLEREKVIAKSPDNLILRGGFAWCGKDKHVITYPISPTIINILFFKTIPDSMGEPLTGPTVSTAPREEVMELYKDWEPDLRTVTELVGETSKWAISQVRGLPQYVDGRVALLGDAAHAMTTHFGAGAGQAIEDAYVLGRLLAHRATDRANAADALRIYDAVRRPVASAVVERSLRVGLLYELVAAALPPGTDAARVHAGDRAEMQKVADEMVRIWAWHGERMPEEDWLRAQEMLRVA